MIPYIHQYDDFYEHRKNTHDFSVASNQIIRIYIYQVGDEREEFSWNIPKKLL